MATRILATVTPAGQGGTYTSVAAALTALAQNLPANDSYVDVEISGDWTGVTDSTSYTFIGWTSDATRNVRIYTVGAANHGGNPWKATAYKRSVTLSTGGACSYLQTDGLMLNADATTAIFWSENTPLTGVVHKNTIIHNGTHTTLSTGGNFNSGSDTKFINPLVFNVRRAFYSVNNCPNVEIINATIYAGASSSYGILRLKATNCGVFGFATACFSAIQPGSNYLVSSDITADDVALVSGINKTSYASYFASVTPGSEDFHLLDDSATLFGVGGNSVSGVTTDIAGTNRSIWDIGAYETSSSGLVSSDTVTFSNVATLTNLTTVLMSSVAVAFSASAVLTDASAPTPLNIVLLTTDATHRTATYIKTVLESPAAGSNIVTVMEETAIANAASFGTPDLIFVARKSRLTSSTSTLALRDAIDNGIPAIVGGTDAGITISNVYTDGTWVNCRFATSIQGFSPYGSEYWFNSGHDVVAGVTGLPKTMAIHSANTFHTVALNNGHIGVALGALDGTTNIDDISGFAIEAGTLDMDSAPVGARVVCLGWLYSATTITFSADALQIIYNSLEWVRESGTTELESSVNIEVSSSVTLTGSSTSLTSSTSINFSPSVELTNASTIIIDEDFEGSSVNLSLSEVVGAGDSAIIRLYPVLSPVEAIGNRHLGSIARVTGVAGFMPTFEMLAYASGFYHWYENWGANKRELFSEDDGETWQYFANQTIVNGSHVSFSHNVPFTSNVVRVLRCLNPTVSQVGQWFEYLEAGHAGVFGPAPSAAAFTSTLPLTWPAQDYIAGQFSAQTTTLGKTVPECPLYIGMINDTSLMPTSGVKVAMYVVGGTHAGEGIGDHARKFYVEWLLSSHPDAQYLRRHNVIYIMGVLNAPGRVGGACRSSYEVISGKSDANRNFNSLTTLLEVVNIPRDAIEIDLAGLVLAAMIDFHGTYVASISSFVNTGNLLQADFRSRVAAHMGISIPDEGEVPVGSVSQWFETTGGAPLAMIFEHGDLTPLADSHYELEAESIGVSLAAMQSERLIPNGDLEEDLTSFSDITFGDSVTLTNTTAGVLSSNDSIVISESSVLNGVGSLASNISITFGESAQVRGTAALASSIASAFSTAGILVARGLLGSIESISFGETVVLSVSGGNAIVSNVSSSFSENVTIMASGGLGSTDAVTFTSTANLTTTSAHALISNAALVFGESSVLTAAGTMNASVSLSFGDNATLANTAPGVLASEAVTTFSGTWLLTGRANLESSEILGFADNVVIANAGSVVSQSTVSFLPTAVLTSATEPFVAEFVKFIYSVPSVSRIFNASRVSAMSVSTPFPKVSTSKSWYGVDWRAEGYLPIDQEITESSWAIEPIHAEDPISLLKDNEIFSVDKAFIRLSGGSIGNVYKVTNTIEFTGGDTDSRTLYIQVEEHMPDFNP